MTDKNTCISTAMVNLASFGFNLFSALSKSSLAGTSTSATDNILISPYSIASALSLVLAGSTPDSVCQKQLQSVININSHEEMSTLTQNLLAAASADMTTDTGGPNNDLDPAVPTVTLTSANGIWSKSLKESFVKTLQDVHHAEAVSPLPPTYDPIDAYITQHTNGLITNMLEGPIDPLVVAVLVNAVHFKGDWTVQFDRNRTFSGIFRNLGGEEKEARFMQDTRKMNYAEDVELLDGASVVQLDYGAIKADAGADADADAEADFAAFFILPAQKGREGIDEVIRRLALEDASISKSNTSTNTNTNTPLLQVINEMNAWNKIKLQIPRFKMSYGTKSLKNELISMGIQACFEKDGMLMEMSNDPQVHVDEFLHKAVMEVTEEGTEAAAASVGVVMTRSMPRPPIPLTFDRAFVMIVVHKPSMTPLFLAKVGDPELQF